MLIRDSLIIPPKWRKMANQTPQFHRIKARLQDSLQFIIILLRTTSSSSFALLTSGSRCLINLTFRSVVVILLAVCGGLDWFIFSLFSWNFFLFFLKRRPMVLFFYGERCLIFILFHPDLVKLSFPPICNKLLKIITTGKLINHK